MLSHYLLPLVPPLLRFYRTRLLVDLPMILRFLPERGRLLDVGCGAGLLDEAIAKRRPELQIVGVDIDERSIHLAQQHCAAPNVEYRAVPLEEVEGQFDCVSLIDVIHHTTEAEAQALLLHARSKLSPRGYILIKDIARRGGWFSYAHDRYVSRSRLIRLLNPDEMVALVLKGLRVQEQLSKYRFPFPNYYVTLVENGSC